MAGKLFTDREIRTVALFVPLAALVVLAFALARPRGDESAARRAEAEMERSEEHTSELQSQR